MAPALPTVLIVDDDAVLRHSLQSVLELEGYRVLAAASAEPAYELLASQPADAVLLDVRLPAMSGLTLYLAIIHRWPALAGRIALMTGDAGAADVRAWAHLHECTVLRKPFTARAMLAWLRALPARTAQDRSAENIA